MGRLIGGHCMTTGPQITSEYNFQDLQSSECTIFKQEKKLLNQRPLLSSTSASNGLYETSILCPIGEPREPHVLSHHFLIESHVPQ